MPNTLFSPESPMGNGGGGSAGGGAGGGGGGGGGGMIRHNRPLGAPLGTPSPTSQRQDHDDVLPPEPPPPKITAFEQKFGAKRHEDEWDRTPNVTGTGAIHVRCFHCKLNDDALALLEQSVNEWLDAHPQYEVKFVTTAIGEWQGKTKEQHMVVQVWV